MATTTQYFVAKFDNEASGPFVALSTTELTWPGGGRGRIITLVEDVDGANTGKLAVALIAGARPTNNQVLTQGTTTADTNGPETSGNSAVLQYPAYAREDTSLAASGAMAWTGPVDGSTHSFFFDGQAANVVAGEILTFSGGQECEVITVVSDAGASGELNVRWITFIDSLGFPNDNDTFTGDIAGNGVVNGVVHPRCYSGLELHRLLADLKSDPIHAGNDVMSTYKPVPSDKDTGAIINLRGTVTITDEIARHMYGASISQSSGNTLYSGWNIGVTDADGLTEPVLVVNDAIKTNYWGNAFMPDSIQGAIRILQKVREDGVDIDGKRVKGKLLRLGNLYFEAGTTLGLATTSLSLFADTDGNNPTPAGTLAGAPYNTVVITEGYQTIDYGNGNGAVPFALELAFGSATSPQSYERSKYIQREGTSETLFGRNAQLFGGVSLNFSFDAQNGNFTQSEIIAWGTEITYSAQAVSNFALDEVVNFVGSGAKGRVLYDDDLGTTGTLVVVTEPGITPLATDTMLGVTSGTTADVDTVVSNANSGKGLLLGILDSGTTGEIYLQQLIGTRPLDNQAIFGNTSKSDALINGTALTRVINRQFMGGYTGTNWATNFGMSVASANAIAGDKIADLLGVIQEPPNNQQGLTSGLEADMYLTVYPWDGSTLDSAGNPQGTFGEMALTVALTAGVSTTVVVGASNIPDNTPASGSLRAERDSDNELDLLTYSSFDNTTGTFTLVGTAPSAAAISNTVMRGLVDQIVGATQISYTAIVGTPEQVAIEATRGGGSLPIKPARATATFGTSGFNVKLQPQSDL